MKTLACVIAIGVACVGTAVAGRREDPPGRVGEIRAVLEKQVAAWNRGDLEAFMDGYWRSPELTFYSGAQKMAGWDATLARYRKKYQKDASSMGQLEFTSLDVRRLGRDAALVRGEWRLTRRRDTPSGIFTVVMQRIGGAWKIIHDHTAAH